VSPEKSEITLTLLEYDRDEWRQRRIQEGRASALAKEQEAKESAEKITHTLPPEFLGIGIRVEDDVVITDDGHENLTDTVPSRLDEVEALCAEISTLPLG
jgi:Xaa-Pro aminopeptidase